MVDDELVTYRQGEEEWNCHEVKNGIACQYKGGKKEGNRTVLLGPKERMRVVDDNNDVELGGT